MSSVNSIASEKLARLIGTPKCPRSLMCAETTASPPILALFLVPFAAPPTP